MTKQVNASQMNAIRLCITEQMGLPRGALIEAKDSLQHFLKIDDLDMDEIVMSLEEEFEIEFPVHVVKDWKTVGDIETYIANYEDPDEANAPRVAQPKKVAVKMAKEIGEPVKFKNSRPHNLSLIMSDLEKKLKPTKATEGFDMTITGGTVYCMHGAAEVARAVVEINEGFNGFRLYVGNMLVIDHNVGSESHILALCDMARLAGAAMPKSLDEWMVSVIVRYVACVKKSLRYMHHLLNEKDTTQQLFKIQSTFELEISTRVFDFYESAYVVGHLQQDLLRTFTEMLESAKPRTRSCYMTGSSFRPGDDEEEEEEPDSFGAEPIDSEPDDDIVDLLSDLSTPGLIALFNTIADTGHYDFEDTEIYALSGIKRRIEIIQELSDLLTVDGIVKHARATDLKSGDAAIFAGR
jgi:acyl carrier protein